MKAHTSTSVIKVIERVKAERRTAVQKGWREDVAVLDEQLVELRLALLRLRWKETSNASLSRS